MSPESLDLNAIPLTPGVRLLEASAGTGKTFALAHLVLRLVGEEGIGLRRLLVVTFTRAATAELRDRIASRLQQALAALEPTLAPADRDAQPAKDGVLEAWLQRRRAGGEAAVHQLRGRLLLALEEIDAADITTIHGYAGRCLRRWALEAGQPPDLQLETDPSALIAEVVHDYWQQQVLPLGPGALAALRARRIDPALLARLLTALDADPALELGPPPAGLDPERPLAEQWPAQWQALLERFRRLWHQAGAQLEADLCAMAAEWKQAGFSDRMYPLSTSRKPRGAAVEALLALPDGQIDGERVQAVEALQGFFHPGTISRVARKAEGEEREPSLPQRPLVEAIADLVDGPAEHLLHHGCHWGLGELARRRQRQGRCGYAQLLGALDPGPAATASTPLLQAMAGDHDVALIDEFQDTDPVQWRILRLTFGLGAHRLLMVGDPKQAIYRFRGGDLATYQAAADAATERFTLAENRRSTPALIAGLNRLMGAAGLPRSDLVVPEVRARSSRSGPEGLPMQLLWLGDGRPAGAPLPSRSALEQTLPLPVARHLQMLLEQAPTISDGAVGRALRAADICLLVSTHHQAEALRQALERQAIPSRLVSQADVLASPAATALQRLLDALADPADANRLRLLAASPLLGWDGATLAAAPPERWSALAGQLQRLAGDLPRLGLQGVLARLIDGDGLARLACSGRLLADLQQVAQLLQARLHGDPLGAGATADWLRRLRLDPERSISEEQRAHSDLADDAVAVMTVHASKGLEFPVVICPYLGLASGGGRGGPGLRWQPPTGGPRLDLHLNPHWGEGRAAARQAAAAEAAERERLAYVAVTRAAHLLVLAWGPAGGAADLVLPQWLYGEPLAPEELEALADGELRQRLEQAISVRQLPITLLDAPRQPLPPWAGPEPDRRPLACGPVPGRSLRDGWGRASYTAWTHQAHGALAPEALDEGRDTADPDTADPAPVEGVDPAPVADGPWPEQGPLALFPRGAGAGDCLHRILEQLDYTVPCPTPAGLALAERELTRAGLDPALAPSLLEGLEQVRLTPFGGALAGLRLADLPRGGWLNEMGFDLTLGQVGAAGLAAAFRGHPDNDVEAGYAAQLERLPIASRGFLTGSIDLVFSAPADGDHRWWVLDWKSNWLGERDGDGRPLACGPRHYGPQAMRALMAANHYPLQAHLYLVALHRYLAWRLPGYQPERHLGGFVYVFLRGAPGAAAERVLPGPVPGMVVARPPLGRLLALDQALGRLEVEP